ncbi:aminobenzoyl-glutamate utilization protein B [Sporobacter termitidis DSM 10068]|uniref:Aminobenzoyl-glutamate utilization protein B n=1 Tax=Sporobacter termitidis DSM 10068 TaxID=1123282 RepID=A0A1M5XBV1_9FIRM|nr:amidohydrolase [Sporobacter termitidis]SHH97122.1 aminobenzoyl-glutamate utilization protein B [Sporobacter termitidis DSM 10068]
MMKEQIIRTVNDMAEELERLAQDIWSNPELSGREFHTAEKLSAFLARKGFSIREHAAKELPTSFVATWGSGRPVIGFLGEYDALPGCSQAPGAEKKPLAENAPGHACGHNLLGTGLAGAAAAAKLLLEQSDRSGTLRFYGCPAEETLTGKVLMDRAHLFDDCDVCLSWHPMGFNCVFDYLYSALISLRFSFRGLSAHAAEAPDQGRSALDAVELMNIGANYLREHIPDGSRLHYTITHGGLQPNVVPDYAESWYYIRAPLLEQAEQVSERLKKIARGAALMTETEAAWRLETTCSHTRLSPALNRLLYRCMTEMPLPEWTPEDRRFAADIAGTLDPQAGAKVLRSYALPELSGLTLHEEIAPLRAVPVRMAGSSDYSNVSLHIPCAQLFVCCCPPGTPAHTWQMTSCAGSPLGIKGMLYAARALTCAALQLLSFPQELDAVRKEFYAQT